MRIDMPKARGSEKKQKQRMIPSGNEGNVGFFFFYKKKQKGLLALFSATHNLEPICICFCLGGPT